MVVFLSPIIHRAPSSTLTLSYEVIHSLHSDGFKCALAVSVFTFGPSSSGTLTCGLVVVHADPLQLQVAIPVICPCGVDAMFITDDFPELRGVRVGRERGTMREVGDGVREVGNEGTGDKSLVFNVVLITPGLL